MVSSTILLAVLAAIPLATATAPHGARAVGPALTHKHLSRTAVFGAGAATRSRARRGQCRLRPQAAAGTESVPDNSAPAESAPATESAPSTEGNNEEWTAPATPTAEAPAQETTAADNSQWTESPSTEGEAAPAPTASWDDLGLSNAIAKENTGIASLSGPCGQSQADGNSPNGQEWWLNCGVNDGGWNPPHIAVEQLKYVDLSADGVYAPCAQYFDKFYQYGDAHNIPPIMIAAIAMQESTCNPSITGGAGEAGMMQLAGSNCDGAPNGNCYDLDFNIDTGAKYLRTMMDQHGGSVLLGVGAYNGWSAGMTVGTVAEIAANYGCFSQPNLDYMDQLLNGWLQGQSGYERGTYHNRDSC